MKFLSSIWSSASGSIGGTTYYSGAGGIIARQRSTPTNPNSAAQQRARSDFGQAAAGWAGLSASQKTLWNDYAALTPIASKLGGTITVSGQVMFMRWASARELCSESSVGAPTTSLSGLGEAPVGVAIDADTGDATVSIGGSGAPAAGNCYVRLSAALSAGMNSVKQKLIFAGEVDVTAAETSVAVDVSSVAIASAERRVAVARICYDDGRLSQQWTGIVTITGI